mgnify:CR=1 FL=1
MQIFGAIGTRRAATRKNGAGADKFRKVDPTTKQPLRADAPKKGYRVSRSRPVKKWNDEHPAGARRRAA